jgi:hypothetical protein
MHRRHDLKKLLATLADGADEAYLDEVCGKVYEMFRVPIRDRLPKERVALTGKLIIHGKLKDPFEYFVTLGYYPDGRLGEIFIRQSGEGSTLGAIMDAMATAISIGLQSGIPWEVFAAKMAHQRFEPQGMTEAEDDDLKMVSSVLDYLARWVEKKKNFYKSTKPEPTAKEKLMAFMAEGIARDVDQKIMRCLEVDRTAENGMETDSDE